MNKDCYSCKYALEARKHIREGEQVRCAKAEELFGGERWVNVRKGKRGKLLDSKCGTFEPFIGDSSKAPETALKVVKEYCSECKGTGKKRVQFLDAVEFMDCFECGGKGTIEKEVAE